MAGSTETVLITGASAGIGRELAICFAAEGCALVLTARREGKLLELADHLRSEYRVPVDVIAGDLAEPGAAIRLCNQLAGQGLSIDVLVNNAGFGLLGRFAELPLEAQLAMVQLNVTALTELTGRLLPLMLQRGRGGVLNVASTAAYQPGPGMAVYYATKAYVQSFSDALHVELRRSPLTITSLAPGPVETEFGQLSGMDQLGLFTKSAMSARSVAKAGHRAFRQRRRTVTPGLVNRLGTLAGRWLPRAAVLRVVDRMQNRPPT
jgi:uncharacterized protein